VTSVAYSPCGKWIASGGGYGDKTVRIWDAATRAAVGSPLTGHSAVWSVAFSKDGTRLVSGGPDKSVKIWSVGSAGTFECESTLTVDGIVSSLDFSPCGSKIAAVCNDPYGNKNFTVKILSSSGSESAGTFECESTLCGHRYVPFPCVECLLS
jgi:WD40 repeat protein